LDHAVSELENEATFLDMFRLFCDEKLPRNPRLRADMISRIQSSSTKSAALMPFRWYRPGVLLPPLPEPWQKKAFEALRGGRIANITIRNVDESSLQLLRPNNMINDEIVEGYLELIRKSGVTVGTTRLLQTWSSTHPIDRTIDIDGLKCSGSVLFPIHDSAMSHWTFAHIMLSKDGTIVAEHFDSIYTRHTPMILEEWLLDSFQGISATIISGQSPQQRNGVDCGLYMLMGIRMMAFGSQHLTQTDADEIMPTFRQRVLAEILAGALDPDPSTYASFVMADEAAGEEIQPRLPSVTYNGRGESDQPICLDTPRSSPTIDEELQLHDECIHSVKTDANTRTRSSNNHTDELNQRASPISLNPPPVLEKPASGLHASMSRKAKADTLVKNMIEAFAEENPMIEMLKSAVMAYRTKVAAVSGSETLASLWSGVAGEGNPQHTLITRHDRERFSRAFYRELEGLGWSEGRVVPRIRVRMEAKLNCSGDQGTWKAAQAQASRSSIWTQLVDCTSPFVSPSSRVAMCAISQSTTVVESLNQVERGDFIRGIERRLSSSHNLALRNLRAASSLYNAITTSSLPHHTVTIERIDDLRLLDFATIVNLAEPPARLVLPS
jgi:hypothetical protein